MTSGEALFILAFIVLPTAILVSSIWAAIFVWRRPRRVVPGHHAEPVNVTNHDSPDIMDTALIEVIEREPEVVSPANEPSAANTSTPVSEPVSKPEIDDTVPEPEKEPDAIELPQPTEDLDEIVERITELETVVEPDAPTQSDCEEEPAFTQTSELPVIEPPARAAELPPPVPAPATEHTEPESSWRRRRQNVKLRPTDAEAPRKRGRNREIDRQVPQLGRSARRRDSAPRNTPPASDHDQDSAPGNR